jgi:hypothetical protein
MNCHYIISRAKLADIHTHILFIGRGFVVDTSRHIEQEPNFSLIFALRENRLQARCVKYLGIVQCGYCEIVSARIYCCAVPIIPDGKNTLSDSK